MWALSGTNEVGPDLIVAFGPQVLWSAFRIGTNWENIRNIWTQMNPNRKEPHHTQRRQYMYEEFLNITSKIACFLLPAACSFLSLFLPYCLNRDLLKSLIIDSKDLKLLKILI